MKKSRLKATVLDHTIEIVLTVATVMCAISMNHLMGTDASAMEVVAIVAVSFVVYQCLANLAEQAVGPTIDRLRGMAPADEDADEQKADV